MLLYKIAILFLETNKKMMWSKKASKLCYSCRPNSKSGANFDSVFDPLNCHKKRKETHQKTPRVKGYHFMQFDLYIYPLNKKRAAFEKKEGVF
jgi:hypothetical protein